MEAPNNTIYIIYECDDHRRYDSMVMKLMTTSKKYAIKIYNRMKGDYMGMDDDWYLNLSEYKIGAYVTTGSNVLRDMKDPFLTTEK